MTEITQHGPDAFKEAIKEVIVKKIQAGVDPDQLAQEIHIAVRKVFQRAMDIEMKHSEDRAAARVVNRPASVQEALARTNQENLDRQRRNRPAR